MASRTATLGQSVLVLNLDSILQYIEVVSTNWRDDYAALGGLRYIGHPKQSTLSIYTMDPETGEFGMPQQFRGDNNIKSTVVPELAVTANYH